MDLELYAVGPRHAEELLASELQGFGATQVRPHPLGVEFRGTLETAYRACLWSRVAVRVFMPLARFAAATPKDVYAAVREIHWQDHMSAAATFVVDCTRSSSPITHTRYASQVVKDGVADYFRDVSGRRPSVDRDDPDIRLNLHLAGEGAILSLDLSGESLHRRGYRTEGGVAPLRENVAAAMLLRARWPDPAGPFVDPMCGSGTLPIEAAMIAGDVAPGLLRRRFGFQRWRGHHGGLWKQLREEAEERRQKGLRAFPPIYGSDAAAGAIAGARENAARAGLRGLVRLSVRDLADLRPPEGPPGLLAVNPPYGERLGDRASARELYAELGRILAERFGGWRVAVLAGDEDLAHATGLRAARVHHLDNGPIACTLAHFDLGGESPRRVKVRVRVDSGRKEQPATQTGIEMFENRLRKNQRALARWISDEEIHCYRVYDADMPEYNVAIDLYEGKWAHVQEYAAPKDVAEEAARRRLKDVLEGVGHALGVRPADTYLKQRRPHGRKTQYERLSESGVVRRVREEDYVFLVNLSDYIDTGLFLDHRITRAVLRDLAIARRFLNLFCYTGTATVAAARGGATGSISVDTSHTYLDWAAENLRVNGFDGPEHKLVRADARDFLAGDEQSYGLIFIDPPTFSNAKGKRADFDVQRDHAELIGLAARRLSPDGTIVFSCNFRRFQLDRAALSPLSVQDITAETIPPDYIRNNRIHQCFLIRHPSPAS